MKTCLSSTKLASSSSHQNSYGTLNDIKLNRNYYSCFMMKKHWGLYGTDSWQHKMLLILN